MLNNNRFTCLVESNSAKQEVSKTYSDTSPVSEYSQSYALGSFLSYFTYLCLFFCFSNHLDDALIFARVISSFEVRSTIYYFNFQIPNIRFFHFFQTLFVSKNYIAQNVHFVDLRLGRKWLMPSAWFLFYLPQKYVSYSLLTNYLQTVTFVAASVTIKKSPNVQKSSPKMISLEKWMILTFLQK